MEEVMLNEQYRGFMEASLVLSDAYGQGQITNLDFYDKQCLAIARQISGKRLHTIDACLLENEMPVVLLKSLNAVYNGVSNRNNSSGR